MSGRQEAYGSQGHRDSHPQALQTEYVANVPNHKLPAYARVLQTQVLRMS